MKLTALILLTACLQVSATGFSQKITLSVKDAPLEKIFTSIEKQTDYNFLYNHELLKSGKLVSVHLKDATLQEALTACFKEQPFTFEIINKLVVVREKPKPVAHMTIEEPQPGDKIIDVRGRVLNEKGEPVEGVTVTVKGSSKTTITDKNGEFSLATVEQDAILVFTHVSMESFELKVSGKTDLAIRLKTKISALGDVQVTVNTGYEKIPKERATGSFGFINNEELNRKVGNTILDRLEGVTTGILFDRRRLTPNQSSVPLSKIMIRGLSTLTESMKSPLIILNNFPYEGDINNINPNDVENITILRDAGAASIWGAKAANGVIVITTKQGKFNQKNQLTFNTNLQVTQKPDLFYRPQMTINSYIENEQFLFNYNFYDDDLNNPVAPALSPVVEILEKKRSGLLSNTEVENLLNSYRSNDVRRDFESYIYRKGINQQNYLNFSGGSSVIKYSIAGGLDKSQFTLKGNDYQRATFRTDLTFQPIQSLQLSIGTIFTNSFSKNNSIGEYGGIEYEYRPGAMLYPYAKFKDESGNILEINRERRSGFIDTAGAGMLLDWRYRPLDELSNNDNKTRLTDLLLNIGANYKINNVLSLQLIYQQQRLITEINRLYNSHTYFSRDLINEYSQIQGANIIYPIPLGSIFDQVNTTMISNNGRGQINFNKTWNNHHQFISIAGAEIREKIQKSSANRLYGYSPENLSYKLVDYVSRYPLYGTSEAMQIPNFSGVGKINERFLSLFANAAYTYNSKYTLSASLRRDAANIFGANTNDKWSPFWTVGASWLISNEPFLKDKTVNYLKARATYGYQGNVNTLIPAFTVLNYQQANSSSINQPYANISVPANPDLSWETLKQINLGFEFALLNSRVSGTFDIFRKASNNLILRAEVDPTTGIPSVNKNSASMVGNGIDISLSSVNIAGQEFKWITEIGYSHITNKVTDFKQNTNGIDNGTLLNGGLAFGLDLNPQKGTTPYAIFSYPFAGLDHNTGDPQGYLGKSISTDYYAIYSELNDTASLVFHGSAIPTHFGYLNNTFRYKGFSLFVNINYRLGYYFRKPTISYYSLNYSGKQHPDFEKRWKNPGDEATTNIPSRVYPVGESLRDDFFAYSTVNVLKGDHIRLQNIRLSYNLNSKKLFRGAIKTIQIYSTLENIGFIWRANKEKLDPDFGAGTAAYNQPKVISAGLKLDF